MGVEPVQSESIHVSAETGNEEKSSLLKENGELNNGLSNEDAKSGSDESNKGGAKNVVVSEANLPKDAVDEWPAPKQIHSFYFVRYRLYDDQQLKTKSDQADRDLQKLNQNRFQITEKLRAKRVDRAELISQLKSLGGETKQYRMIMDEKRKEMEPLTQALGKLRNKNSAGQDRGVGICSSEEELNDLIKSLEYRMTHESIPLTEEKKIMREIKQLEATRDKVIANAQMRAEIQGSLGQKEVIQDQVKHLGVDLDGVRKEQQVVKAKLKQLDDEKVAIEKQINALQEELMIVTEKRDKAYEKVIELRKQREQGNSCFYQYRSLLNKAKELASKTDVEALKEHAQTEVDTFMSKWSNTKAFRDDYEKRILASLDQRQLSRDGRIRNPDEKPLVPPVVPPVLSEPEVTAKPKPKEAVKEESNRQQQNISSAQKVAKEKNDNKQQKEETSKVTEDKEKDNDEILSVVKEEKVLPKVDEAKLKELKREEEIAKAKQALERKKKLTEKAAAKAAIKAQREAEKKLKEREKKAKKKAAAASGQDTEEQTESAAEEVETENSDEKVEAASVPTKQRKENPVKYRGRGKGQDSLPKIILKRKKSSNQWLLWAAPIAVLLLLLLLTGYYYLF